MPLRRLITTRGAAPAAVAVLACGMTLGLALPAAAQRIESLTLAAPAPKAGAPVLITAHFDISGGLNCNVRLSFGDGNSTEFKVNQTKDQHYEVRYVFAKPGSYTLRLEGRNALPVLRCLGDAVTLPVTVGAAR
jgi:hypothetical protein